MKDCTSAKCDSEPFISNRMAMIGGQSFRCDCGCNVFHSPKNDELLYICNACNARWRGVR